MSDDLWRRLHRSMCTALENGHTNGASLVQVEDDDWRALVWQEVGPKWCAVAVGNGATPEAARSLADERLADEVAKHGDHPAPGARVRHPSTW